MFARVGGLDILWAGISPVVAFLIRDGAINRPDVVAVYCVVALLASLIAFQWFKISSPLPSFFSADDGFLVIKACLTTAALTAVCLFIFTRLEDAPRSIPVIHFFLLLSGLLGLRLARRSSHAAHNISVQLDAPVENIILIGATRLAWYFCKLTQEFSPGVRHVQAILDDNPGLQHRTLCGYPIIGSLRALSKIVDEYATHGIDINKVVVADNPKELTASSWIEILQACDSKGIPMELLHEQFPFSKPVENVAGDVPSEWRSAELPRASYLPVKRVVDIVAAVVMLIILSPLAAVVAMIVAVDVGCPLVFWQRRVGYLGRAFNLYKFRTMQTPVDGYGRSLSSTERVSQMGRFLRHSRLDELPQLFNILSGDMSLVGPRPLLPIDQPKNFAVRVHVRPGLTGFAQVNGGILLSAEEKDALDQWYVQQASFLLDVRIILSTVWMIIRGDRRNEKAIAAAVECRGEGYARGCAV